MIRHVALTSFMVACMHGTAGDDNQLVGSTYQHVRVLGIHMCAIAVVIKRLEGHVEEK